MWTVAVHTNFLAREAIGFVREMRGRIEIAGMNERGSVAL